MIKRPTSLAICNHKNDRHFLFVYTQITELFVRVAMKNRSISDLVSKPNGLPNEYTCWLDYPISASRIIPILSTIIFYYDETLLELCLSQSTFPYILFTFLIYGTSL